MKILIIGASGLVGSHCLRFFKEKDLEVIGTHRNYKTDKTFYFDPLVNNCFDFLNKIDFHPQVILHCGALTNVEYCEENEDESNSQTLKSTEVIVNYCIEKNVKLVYISTDYVFDGLDGPYAETANPNPINVYGKHKLAAEKMVEQTTNYIIARITNVYGEEERSKNFIAHLLNVIYFNIDKEIRLPYDQFATPIYAGDIAEMLLLLLMDNKCGIYNLASTDYYSRYHLALKVKSYFSDSECLKLNPISTISLKQKAQRPLKGGLINSKFSIEYPQFEYTNIDKFILKTIIK